MMSDALAAANMISGDLAFYRMMDGIRAARAQNNDAVEIARLQALVQRLADYGRYAEQQHNSLLAEAKRIDAERCQQINAQLKEIATLQAQVDMVTATSAQRAEELRLDYNCLVADYNLLLRDLRALQQKTGEQV